jgi:hypothetical protein
LKLVVCLGLGLLSAACGGSTASEPGSGGAAGYAETGGASGSGGAGGTSPVVSRIPDGSVKFCDGSACPGGECADDRVFDIRACSATISSSYEYCDPGATGTHCLVITPPSALAPEFFWLVACMNGSAAMWECPGGCESESGVGARCR